jgi:hypothetical protein
VSHDPHADQDFLRRPACDVHYWCAVDHRDDVYRCRYCSLTWSLDDDPDDGGRAA